MIRGSALGLRKIGPKDRVCEVVQEVLYTVMAGKRSPGQTLVAFPLDENLLLEIDAARGRVSRSQWIREAIGEKLLGMGIP